MTEQLLFCGNNRKRDLQRLTAIFDACVVSAADLAVSPAGPRHRVVMIEAERGLGKTRLALELLRHMMQAGDRGGYWPREICDTANGAIMPRPEECQITQPPPFL